MMLFEPTTFVRKRALERRIERHVSGTVDDDVGVPHYLSRLFFVEPEILVADIAVDRHDLAT